jgi:hypothetical protein
MNANNPNAGVTPIAGEAHKPAATASGSSEPLSNGETAVPTAPAPSAEPTNGPSDVKDSAIPSSSSALKAAADKEREKQEQARRKAEQREKLREHEKARRKAMEERVKTLSQKMIERLRPFVEAKNPGGEGDSETTAFTEKMKREVEDLKLESFGIEVCVDHFFLLSGFDKLMLVVVAHDRKRLHHESNVVHEVPQVLGHVSPRFKFKEEKITDTEYGQPWLFLPSQGKRHVRKGCLGCHWKCPQRP